MALTWRRFRSVFSAQVWLPLLSQIFLKKPEAVVQTLAQHEMAQKNIATQQAQLEARRSEMNADQTNEYMREEIDIVQMILEAKNQAVEQVLRMLQQIFAAQLRLQQATASKG